MHDSTVSAFQAAVALSKMLALPSSKATVFAWHTDEGDKIVVSGDLAWIRAWREVPSQYLGFRVVVRDPLDGIAHQVFH